MENADIIIENGTILTMDDKNTVVKNGFLAIEGDRITCIGDRKTNKTGAKRSIDARGGLIIPGLVNGHTHAAMSLFRGLADDLPLMEWLNNYIFPVESRMDADFVRAGTRLACAEMIMSGTTTFCDMYLFEDDVARAAREVGMRCLVGEVLYDFPSPNYGSIQKGLEYTESLINNWRKDPLVSIAVEPHAIFTCSPDLLIEAKNIATRYGVPLIMHVAETLNEIEEVGKKYGKRPFEHLESLGILGEHFIADHCVHLNESEMDIMARYKVCAVNNPESNMKLASGVSPITELTSRGITLGLGTDGCASNNNLDLFTEMDTAAKIHKINTMDPTVLKAEKVLRMATTEGAKVLGMDDIIGSLETGKKADVIVIDTNKPHLTPMYNPFSHIVYSSRGSDVIHSIINGCLVMDDRKLLTLDVNEVMSTAIEKSRQVRAWVS